MKRIFWTGIRYTATFIAGALCMAWFLFTHAGPLSRGMMTTAIRLSAASHEPVWSLSVADELPSEPVSAVTQPRKRR